MGLIIISCSVGYVTALPHATTTHGGGPGVGMRLSNTWQQPAPTPIRLPQNTVPDREAAKLEKFTTLLAGPNTDMGMRIKVSLCMYALVIDYW
jgi:hypothetical protein